MEEQEFPITLIYKEDILQDVDFLQRFLLHNQKLRFSFPQGFHVEKLKSINLSQSNKRTKEKYIGGDKKPIFEIIEKKLILR